VAKRGPKERLWRWLVHDVENVRRNRKCSVLDACGYLADGEMPETLPVALPPPFPGAPRPPVRRMRVVMGRWRGMKVATLERKYYLAKGLSPKKHTE
jgi:hypothetical protein